MAESFSTGETKPTGLVARSMLLLYVLGIFLYVQVLWRKTRSLEGRCKGQRVKSGSASIIVEIPRRVLPPTAAANYSIRERNSERTTLVFFFLGFETQRVEVE